jgi:anaerobic ribonucleoside-triphosphate reductase
MFEKVIKRNGDIVSFDKSKIAKAIEKSLIAYYINLLKSDRRREELVKLADVITDKVVYTLSKKQLQHEYPTVEEIQDTVEETLMEVGERQVAKAYIKYRLRRQEIRELEKTLINSEETIDEYMKEGVWEVKENSNMDYSLQGLNNHIISKVTKNFWLNRVYSDEIRRAHEQGDVHIHDLGLLAPYCCGWDFEDLLIRGFGGVPNKIESKPARHFKTALGQLVNFFYTLQGEAAGAQAISSFDTYLAPFVYFDKLNYKEVKQALQEFIFNINVPTRVGFQTPFVNLTMDIVCPNMLRDMPVIYGGKRLEDYSYGQFQKEMDMINMAFCEVMEEGDAKGRVFTFPIPTYNITPDFDWDSPVVDRIMHMAAKYGLPYFANFLNSNLSPDDIRSMCCRLRLDNRELRKRGGGLFGANPLTGSIGVVTINMARLGYLSETEEEFFERLRYLMDLAKTSLETKRKVLEQNTRLGLYPYSRYYLSAVYERFGEYWKNHFNTIGLNGVNEAIRNFFDDKEDISTPKGRAFAEKILDYMRDVIMEYQEDGSDLYNLEATPAEGTAYRLALIDKKMYPDIITAGEEEPYYTNSTQLPVGFTEDIFTAIELQENLQVKYTGGTVLHGFLGERIHDIETCKNLVKKVMENYRIPYFTISPTFSICKDHGYITGEHFNCPTCKKQTEVWTRVVGFHRPVQNWNKGKQEEYKERLEFVV